MEEREPAAPRRSASVAGGLRLSDERARGDLERRERVGARGVEGAPVVGQILDEGEAVRPDAFDDGARELVAAVVVVVRAVVGGESLLRLLGAERFVEGLARGVEVDEGRAQLLRRLAHGVVVVAVRVRDLARAVEGAALHRRDEDDGRAPRARLLDVAPEGSLVGRERADALPLLLLVVVAELYEEVVAGPHQAQDLVEAARARRAAQGLARLGVVGDREAGFEEAREHLAPTVVGLARLVTDGRVAEEEERRGLVVPLNLNRGDGGAQVVEFERELLVPGPGFHRLLAVFELDLAAAAGNPR